MKLLILLALFCGAMAQTTDVPDPVNDGKPDEARPGVWTGFNEASHIFYSTPQTWGNAQMHCLASGGHLVVLNSKEEEDFVKGLAGGKDIWIGLSDAQQYGSWFWINSQPLGYTNWCPGEPNNYGGIQQCAVTNYSGLKCWDDQDCGNYRSYVCEREEH